MTISVHFNGFVCEFTMLRLLHLGSHMDNPGVIQGLPILIPFRYLHPCMGYGYSQVWVEGTMGCMGQKTHAGLMTG